MIIIIAEEGKKIHLGRVGENEARAVRFDIGNIQAEFPGASFSVLNMRPSDPDAYPVNGQYIALDGSYLLWTIQSGDLAEDGLGECELKATLEGVIVKSIIWTTEICPALDGNGTPPEPWESWQQQVEDDADRAEAAAEDSEAWAIGERGGEPVAEGDETYHNNAKYWADQAEETLASKADKADTVLDTTLSRGRKANTTVGDKSFAFGDNVEASGLLAFGTGDSAIASGIGSFAEGIGNTSSGYGTHSEGYMTTSSGEYGSHAEGVANVASKSAAHAEGQNNTASGMASHVDGMNNTANHKAQHVFGEYNVPDPSTQAADKKGNFIEIVGNGTSAGAKSNARTLDWNGNERLKGKLFVNANADGTGGDEVLTEHQDISGKADKVSGGTADNFAGLDAEGNLKDSGKAASDFVAAEDFRADAMPMSETDPTTVAEKATELKSATDYLHDTVLDYEELAFTPSTYIRNDTAVGETVTTTQVSSASYSSLKYACKKGQRFIITVNGGSAARAYSFVDADSKQVLVSPADTNYSNELIVAPTDGYFLCNCKSTLANPVVKAEYFKVEEDVETLKKYEDEILLIKNLIQDLTYTTGYYYSTGYGNTASNTSCGIYTYATLEPNKTYTVKNPYLDFTWLKKGANVGVNLNTLDSFVDNGDNTYTFTTWDTTDTIKFYLTIADANAGKTYLAQVNAIPDDAKQSGFVYIPNLATEVGNGKTLFVSKSYTSSTPGWGVTKFASVIDAVAAVTDSSETNPYTIMINAGTSANPATFDDWDTVYGGHVSDDVSYVGVQLPSYLTITTTAPTHPERVVLSFDGHAGISDTMTYNDAYKKALFHINGRKMGIVIEGVTLQSKDCRYAFHPESGVDGYGVSWELKNCIIDWQGCPHASESGWSGVTAVGVGLGYGGKGKFDGCKWVTNEGVTTAIGGHTNGWNPGVTALPIMPGATIEISNCDFGGYNVFMTNSTNTNELNNILDFYNVVNCSGNDSTGWVEILRGAQFTD